MKVSTPGRQRVLTGFKYLKTFEVKNEFFFFENEKKETEENIFFLVSSQISSWIIIFSTEFYFLTLDSMQFPVSSI